jgi:hypothetical protein
MKKNIATLIISSCLLAACSSPGIPHQFSDRKLSPLKTNFDITVCVDSDKNITVEPETIVFTKRQIPSGKKIIWTLCDDPKAAPYSFAVNGVEFITNGGHNSDDPKDDFEKPELGTDKKTFTSKHKFKNDKKCAHNICRYKYSVTLTGPNSPPPKDPIVINDFSDPDL